ncbi:MAG: hypothetical protein AAGI10_09465 [Pseudomonadota bacterium]
MSNTDSFIEEVTEEVRRDRLFGYLRRYGWIAGVVIVALVGGTAFNEYRKAQAEASAQARGDAIVNALENQDEGARAAALAELAANGPVEAFLAAADQQGAGDLEGAATTLTALAETPELSPLYRDLALIKRLSFDTTISTAERSLLLDGLAAPGAPYRTIAEEMRALDLIAAGEQEAAIDALQSILQDADASDPQKTRVSQLVIALGATPELATSIFGDTDLAPSE